MSKKKKSAEEQKGILQDEKVRKKKTTEIDFVNTFPGDDAEERKAAKLPRIKKVKTTKELVEDMQKLEKRILNEVVKNPARASEIGRMYMAGYNTFSEKQRKAYKEVARVVGAR